MSTGTAFVVGGTGGLGRLICQRLAEEWSSVAIGYRSRQAEAENLAAELTPRCQALAIHCDLSDATSVTRAVASVVTKTGGIATMIFAGGAKIAQPFVSQIDEAAWREVVEIELIGFIRVVTATLPIFRRQNGGNFVSLVSVATYCFPPGDALSAVPKAGIEMLGRAIAKEEGKFGIRANMVAPGIINAGLGAGFLNDLYTPDIWEAQRRKIALRAFGDGADVAEAVAFLASARARYITGHTLVVDGGFSL